jgi:hypothetical protein
MVGTVEGNEGNGADQSRRARSSTERSRAHRARKKLEREAAFRVPGAVPSNEREAVLRRQQSLNRLFVDMAGEILRAPYSVDERAALLSWAALAFMRSRKGASA